jgi:hypothetical protein
MCLNSWHPRASEGVAVVCYGAPGEHAQSTCQGTATSCTSLQCGLSSHPGSLSFLSPFGQLTSQNRLFNRDRHSPPQLIGGIKLLHPAYKHISITTITVNPVNPGNPRSSNDNTTNQKETNPVKRGGLKTKRQSTLSERPQPALESNETNKVSFSPCTWKTPPRHNDDNHDE